MTNTKSNKTIAFWAVTVVSLFGLLFSVVLAPELKWLAGIFGGLSILAIGLLVKENLNALKSKSVANGAVSGTIALLVIAIVGVANFLGFHYSHKFDLTKNKSNTLSDQSIKLVKSLTKPLKLTHFDLPQNRDKAKSLLDNYKALNTKIEVEYVDPNKEPTRAKQLNIKKYGTLVIENGPKQNQVDDISEEKITNALIKIIKEKSQVVCAITGHGEKSFTSTEADGYDSLQKSLVSQTYEFLEVNLPTQNKIPENCSMIAIMGSNRAFFDNEIKAISDYLANGGKAVFGIDLTLKGADQSQQLAKLLETWHVRVLNGLIVDPTAKVAGSDAAVPIVATYAKDHAITKDFQNPTFFPVVRPLEIVANPPQELKVNWIAQTTPNAWGVMTLADINKGAVQFKQGIDKKGPLSVAIAVEGKLKDSKATQATRIVVFGTSLLGVNQYIRFAGNSDLVLNAFSWAMSDDSMISIRPKEEGGSTLELSNVQANLIFLITVILIPALVAIGGVVFWMIRRKW